VSKCMYTMSRPDRSDKLLNRKIQSETVVKCSLNKLLVNDDYSSKFKDAVERRMMACSIRTWTAMVCLNLLIRELFNGIADPTQVQLPDFVNQTFLRQLLLGTKGSHKPYPQIESLYNRYPQLVSDQERHLGDRNIYSAAAIKLATNIQNHLIINFPRFLKKYLYKVTKLSKNEAVEALYLIHGWTKKKHEEGVDMDKVHRYVNRVKYILGLENDTKITKPWLKNNIASILRLFVFINQCLERKELPLFNILPIMKTKAHFVTLDTSSFIGIVKEIGLASNVSGGLEKDFWFSVFNLNSIQGKGKTFTGTMDTDGVVVNVHFQMPKVVGDGKAIDLTGKRVIGVDPGRTNIFQMVEELDGSFKEYKLTRKQYYTEAGIFEARKHTNHWNKQIQEELKELSEASPKSVKLESFVHYITTSLKVKEAVWSEYFKKRWRQQRFRLYGGKKRVFSKFLNRLGPLDNTVLAYGSAKFAPGGKGELSVPTSRAFKECSYRVKTVLVDEFRTSKIHWEDGSILQLVKKGMQKDAPVVRGLLWCHSTIMEKSKFVNRDRNAAINILHCATLSSRPLALQRKPGLKKINQRVGRRII